jgi:hypothetical protein
MSCTNALTFPLFHLSTLRNYPSLTHYHFISLHFTSLHFTSLPFPSLPFPSLLTSLPFTSLVAEIGMKIVQL